MDLESTRTLRGPNLWSNLTVIEAVLVTTTNFDEGITPRLHKVIPLMPAEAVGRLSHLLGSGRVHK